MLLIEGAGVQVGVQVTSKELKMTEGDWWTGGE